MKTFNTMEELYEALKPFEPDDAVYISLESKWITFCNDKFAGISDVRLKHNMDYENMDYWKIPRPIDLSKYIGKVVRINDYHKQDTFQILNKNHIMLLESKMLAGIEPLTSDDICPVSE